MESEIKESLTGLGYNGMQDEEFQLAINEGYKSLLFRECIAWLANEIKIFAKLDEQVNTEAETFMLELSGFLKELQCPYSSLVTGHLSERLQTTQSRLMLLDFLVCELMGLRMCFANKPEDTNNIITICESKTANALKEISISLNMVKPPENITPKMCFDKIKSRIDEVIKKTSILRLEEPLFNPKTNFNAEQWKKLEIISKELDNEYNLRRTMLLTRLDVTIQSFQWSEKKLKIDDISKIYIEKRKHLDCLQTGGTNTDISALLAARKSIAIIEKTSSSNVRRNTKSKIQRHIIGMVPDRGGRANEHAVPLPEMPSWSKRTPTDRGGGGGGGRGGGGGHRGGANRGGGGGGYNQPYSNQQPQQQYGRQTSYDTNNPRGGQVSYDNHRGGGGQTSYDNHRGGGGQNSYDNNTHKGGSGNFRVQGGWAQRGGGGGRGRDYQDHANDFSTSASHPNDYSAPTNYDNNYNRGGGGGGQYRGRSNYQRGGRR